MPPVYDAIDSSGHGDAACSSCHISGDMDGQAMVFFVMTVAAAEAAIGLAVILALFRNKQTVQADQIGLLKW